MIIYFIALLNVLANLYITDIFLNYQFLNYAKNVLEYGSAHQDRIFPKLSKCTFYRQESSLCFIALYLTIIRYGPSGSLSKLDAICLLPLNILNEKIYLVLYFW